MREREEFIQRVERGEWEEGGPESWYCAGTGRSFRVIKMLMHILRRWALDHGIETRTDGYCSLDEVLRTEWMIKENVSEE